MSWSNGYLIQIDSMEACGIASTGGKVFYLDKVMMKFNVIHFLVVKCLS